MSPAARLDPTKTQFDRFKSPDQAAGYGVCTAGCAGSGIHQGTPKHRHSILRT